MAEIKVPVVRNILQANERLAAENRRRFDDAGIFVVNLMSSPGAGKTSLLEKTIEALLPGIGIAVIEGDLQSSYDAERIQKRRPGRPDQYRWGMSSRRQHDSDRA